MTSKNHPVRFLVTIICLDDGERAALHTERSPAGFSLSPALVGRKVAAVLRHYHPLPPRVSVTSPAILP